MSGPELRVVFGAGQVGLALASRLAQSGSPVRSVSRRRPTSLPEGVDWCAADAGDPATDAAKGASVVYQCLNAPYTEWPKQFPPLQRAVSWRPPSGPMPSS
jgi:predicted dinucleotide-binding enzyme